MFEFLTSRLKRQGAGDAGASQAPAPMQAAVNLPPVEPPKKVPNKQITPPSYLTTLKPSTKTPFNRSDRTLANKNLADYRVSNDSRQVIKDFARSDPNLSAAVTSYVRVGVTEGYTAIARNMDGTVSKEGTAWLAQILARMNYLNDYTLGYDDGRSIRSISEAWAREIIEQGAMCGELVLDKARLPSHIHPIASAQVRMFPSSDGKKLVPKQYMSGTYIDLDVPTFFMVYLDEDLTNPYPVSPIESAIQAVLTSVEFQNDLRRVVRRAIHPRADITIDEEKFKKNIPAEMMGDTDSINAYMTSVVAELEQKINGLEPEDALVHFDTVGIEIVNGGNTNLANEYTTLREMSDARIAAGAKTLPVVLGHGDGTSNTASAETLIFMKFVEGAVWGKLNEMFSKMLTLAVRLGGHDVYVQFRYNAIDLKPESELEAFKAMKQSRIMEQLSYGFITDEQASIELTGALPGPQFKPLSGTGFFNKSAAAEPAGDGYNGASNGGSTMNQNLKPTTPTAPKGGAGKSKADLGYIVVQ